MTTMIEKNPRRFVTRLEEPPVARSLFGDVRWAWLWLILRLYVGYEWFNAGWEKLNNRAWIGKDSGAELRGPGVRWVIHHLNLGKDDFRVER